MSLLRPELAGTQAIIFDLDGTLYNGDQVIPGAVETVRRLKEAGIPLRFLTNTTSRGRAALAEKLQHMGFPVVVDEVYGPPWAAGEFLRSRGASAYLLVPEGALADFEGVPLDDAHPDYVVVGDMGDAWTFPLLNRAFRLVLEEGAQLIGLGRSRYWRAPDGLRLDAGPFVAALEYATGKAATIIGKPESTLFEAALHDLGLPAERVVMVGDDVEVDVRGAQRVGLRGALVRTGKFRQADLARGVWPDLLLDSVVDLLTS
ncbi:MAG: TIGR01458 family HAD-type hydrolase [Anaerolineae bacterium]|nr:TIGR01458 family HAD-type hydrolase [Anaerolineae bacterium]